MDLNLIICKIRILGITSLMCEYSCCCSVAESRLTLCDPMNCSTPGFPVLHSLLELAQTHVHWVSDAIQTSHLLLPPSPLALNFPTIRVFSNEPALHIRWPKYCSFSFSFSISPYNEYSGSMSFSIDWFDLLAVQGLSRESSQEPQFRSLSLALSLLYGPPLTSVPDYWKNHSFEYTNLCQQSDISAF